MRKLSIGLVAIAVLAGCSSKSNVREPAELQDIVSPAVSLKPLWSRDTGSGDGGQWTGLRIAVTDEAVFTADVDGRVTALSPETGKPLWQVKTGARLSAGPTVSGVSLLLGTLDAEVISLKRSDGSEQWRTVLSSEVLAPPASDGDTVVARAVDGRVYGLSAVSGERRWVFDRHVPTLTLRGLSTPLLFSGAAIIGHDNGRVSAVRLTDGSPIWEQVVALPSGRTELDRITDIDATPRIVRDQLIAVSYGGELASMDLRNGEVTWRRSIRSYAGMDARVDRVFVTDDDSVLWSLDVGTGAAAWKFEDLKYRRLTAPVLHGDHLLLGDFEGYLHAFDADTGKLVGRVRAGRKRFVHAPRVVGDRVYVLSSDGRVRAFEIRAN